MKKVEMMLEDGVIVAAESVTVWSSPKRKTFKMKWILIPLLVLGCYIACGWLSRLLGIALLGNPIVIVGFCVGVSMLAASKMK